MCVLFSYLLIGCFFGAAVTRQADIDINRIKPLSNEVYSTYHSQPNRYLQKYNHFKRSNDYDDHSSWYVAPRAPVQSLYDALSLPSEEALKVHQPREDPRLFYQSDSYIQENNRKNIENEVSSIFPGIEVIRAGERYYGRRSRSGRSKNLIEGDYKDLCVKCPADRTLIAKPGSNKVLLQYPRLTTCSGAPVRDVEFSHKYGPKFGSLIGQGSHIIIGQITFNGKQIQMCRMQVHVIVQSCSVPKHLISKCDDRSKVCTFTCQDSNLELHGNSALICRDNITWGGQLPLCRARTWCASPSIPEHGRISCSGSSVGSGLAEGSICRVRCARGWHWSPRAATVCRRGTWTFNITCKPKRTHIRPNN